MVSVAQNKNLDDGVKKLDLDFSFNGQKILVVGGAGFVGSNLVHMLLDENPLQIIIVDNLMSSEPHNISSDPRVEFVFGSITNDKILNSLPDDIDFAFHLACFLEINLL